MKSILESLQRAQSRVYAISSHPSSSLDELKSRIQGATEAEPDSPFFVPLVQGLLIDFGVAHHDIDLISEAVSFLRSVTDPPSQPHIEIVDSELCYFLGSGLYSIYSLSGPSEKTWRLLSDAHLFYQRSWNSTSAITPPDLIPRILVNDGNSLAHLGRWHEAMQKYRRALAGRPDHAMAQGNLAQELSGYARRMGPDARDSLDLARNLMDAALDPSSDLDRTGVPYARESFEQVSAIIDYQRAATSATSHTIRQSKHNVSENLRALYTFIEESDLFLHYGIAPSNGLGSQADTLMFSYITPLDGTEKFGRLVKIFDDMKEAFSLARRNLWEASITDAFDDEYTSWTGYVDTLEYANYGLKSALLKSSITLALSVLDKIALLVHRELNIGSKSERQVYFANVFTTSELIGILQSDAPLSLRALASMALELKSTDTNNWSEWRNAIAHRYLVLHEEDMVLDETSVESEHVRMRAIYKGTLALLGFTKSAMLYLVDWLEEKQANEFDTISGKIIAPWGINYQIGYVRDPLDFS